MLKMAQHDFNKFEELARNFKQLINYGFDIGGHTLGNDSDSLIYTVRLS